MWLRGGIVKRTGWALADQGLSSITNFTLSLIVARTVGPAAFGAFSLALATYLIALGISRALGSEPLLVRFSGESDERWRDGTSHAAGTALVVGVLAGAACWAISPVLGDTSGSTFAALAVVMPGLLLQDAWRQAFFAQGRGARSFLNDLAWAVVQFSTLALLLTTGRDSVAWLVLSWGGGATSGAVLGLFQSRVIPRPSSMLRWLRDQSDLGPRYLGEFAVTTGATQATVYAIGIIGGLAAVGSIRAAQVLLGPLNVFFMGARLAAVPEAVRVSKARGGSMRRVGVIVGGVLGSVTLLWGIFLLLIPASLGETVLADSWPAARRVLLPIALTSVGGAVILGCEIGLRGLAAARRSLRARVVTAGLSAFTAILGVSVAGVLGAAWGFAIGLWVGVVVWWTQFLRAVNEHENDSVGIGESDPAGVG